MTAFAADYVFYAPLDAEKDYDNVVREWSFVEVKRLSVRMLPISHFWTI